MKRYITLILALAMMNMVYACGKEETDPTSSQGTDESTDKGTDQNSDQAAVEPDHNNGICEPGEKAISITCDNYTIVTRHADPACSEDNLTYEEKSCFKYAYVVEEAENFTFNQKGTCKVVDGLPTCVRDEEYACSDAFKHKVKCVAGYKIGYWSVASCGEVTVERTDSCSEE